MKIAVIGATGLVGQTLINIAQERKIQGQWLFFASQKEDSRFINFQGQNVPLLAVDIAAIAECDIAFMLTPSDISAPIIERLLQKSAVKMIDNAATYRMASHVPLIIPEINMGAYDGQQLIANPNCVTIQLLLALNALKGLELKTVFLTSFQSVSGSGWAGLHDLQRTTQGLQPDFYPFPIAANILPQCDMFQGDWTLEERKIMQESRKISGMSYSIYPTCTRVPVPYGHQISLSLVFKNPLTQQDLQQRFEQAPRICFMDQGYALNTTLYGSDNVFVSRLRCLDDPCVWHCWVGADNLRVGAATNALNIAAHIGLDK
jgi:aspartate-semialdehyde dehydrogenase